MNIYTPHKHAALIKRWADGAPVEALGDDGTWTYIKHPAWDPRVEYRIRRRELWMNRYQGGLSIHATEAKAEEARKLRKREGRLLVERIRYVEAPR